MAHWMNKYLELAGRLLEDAIRHHQDGNISALEKDLQKKRLLELYELLAQGNTQHTAPAAEDLAGGTSEMIFEQEVIVTTVQEAAQPPVQTQEPAAFNVQFEQEITASPIQVEPMDNPVTPEAIVTAPEPTPEVPEPTAPAVVPEPEPEPVVEPVAIVEPIPVQEPVQPITPAPVATPQNGPRRDAREVLGIAQKFMLINQLFGGETDRYNGYFDATANTSSADAAISLLSNFSTADLKEKQEVVEELRELLRKLY